MTTPSTKSRYKSEVMYLLRNTGLDYSDGVPVGSALQLLDREWEKVERSIRGSAPQRGHFQCAMLRGLARDHDMEGLRKRAMDLQETIPKHEPSQTVNEREQQKWMPFPELKKLTKQHDDRVSALVKNKTPVGNPERRLILTHLVLSMNCDMPPLRNDIADMLICRDATSDHDGNVLMLGDRECTIVLRKYKTFKKYGELRVEVPNKVRKAIERSLRLFPRDYVITLLRNPHEPMKSNGFSHFFAEAIPDKRLGSSICRKMYVSHLFRNDHSTQQREDLARRMAHSVNVARSHYEKH